MEENNLLPQPQHGFRVMRSTMTALNEVQKQWAENTEKKEITGNLMWDLSAAFDCLDTCKKVHKNVHKNITNLNIIMRWDWGVI